MKIAFIVTEFPKLSETFILNQITGLLDMGHDVEIFAKFNPKEKKVHDDVEKYHLMDRVHYFDIPHSRVKYVLKAIFLIITNFHKSPLKVLKSLNVFKYGKKALCFKILYLLIPFLDRQFDVIHCHFGPNGNIGAYMKQIGLNGKLIATFYGYDIRLGIEKGGGIYSQLFKFGDGFLSISDYIYKNLIRFGADPQKIIFQPVGIDINKFPFRWQSAIVARPNTVVIITVARLVEEKGLEYGIQAISKLLKGSPELRLEYRIIGEGPLEDQLIKQVKELSLDKAVRFVGPMKQEEVIRNMQQAHIFLLPSIAEAFGVVLLEAQAIGIPTVATNVGSVSQAIVDNKSGFLVPERDIDALVEKLEYLIRHTEIWLEMGKNGRKYVEEHYDINKLNQRLVEIYQNLILDNSYQTSKNHSSIFLGKEGR